MPNLVGGSSSSVSSGLTYYGRGNPTWPHGHSHIQSPTRSRYDERSRHYPPPPPRYHHQQEESYNLDPSPPPPPQRNYGNCSRGGDENRGAEKFHKFTLSELRAMGVQVGTDKRAYTQTTLTQHYPSDAQEGNVIPDVVVGRDSRDTDSVSCVSESQPIQEPPSAIDILAMAGAHAAEGQRRN